jgi:hypothetical protein
MRGIPASRCAWAARGARMRLTTTMTASVTSGMLSRSLAEGRETHQRPAKGTGALCATLPRPGSGAGHVPLKCDR